MAWTTTDGVSTPDGTAFDSPGDSFETVYNHKLALDPEQTKRDVYDPFHGYPLSMRNYKKRPASAAILRAQLNQFFDARYQQMCIEAGNLPSELDTLAKRLLTWAADLGVPVSDRERTMAERLEVDVKGHGVHREDPGPRVY